jgi:hypothetical protein
VPSFRLLGGAVSGLIAAAVVWSTQAAALDFAEFSRARDAGRERAASMRARLPRAMPPRATSGRGALSPAVERRRPAALLEPLPDGPLVLFVSLKQQRLTVFAQGKLIETTTVSTGTSSDPTPTGVFAIIEKNERHFSNLYGGAPMPFMQRLTMSGVALHSGHVTGRPASHGCVRLPHEYARRLFKATKLGARVIVSADEPVAIDLEDMRLLEPARIAAATRRAEAASDSVPDSSSAPAAADKSIDPRTGRPKGPLSLQRDEVLRMAPVSILVSRADARVYVRHMFEPVTEMPISIAEPRRPLGTHVYTLSHMEADGSGQRWSAISVKLTPRRLAAVRVLSGRKVRVSRAAPPAAPPDEGTASTAAEAVERFALPGEIIAQIAPLLRPGASLVVTDLPQSRRTQTGWTDIIVTP